MDQGLDFGIGHGQAQPFDRHAEARAFPADAQIAHNRQFKGAADTKPVDLRHHRMAAIANRAHCVVHDLAIGGRLFGVGAGAFKLADIGAWPHRLFAGAAQDHTAQAFIAIGLCHRLAQAQPHGLVQGVELVRSIEDDGDDGTIALIQDFTVGETVGCAHQGAPGRV